MTLDFVHFTPGASLAGGVLIGGSAALMLLGGGRFLGAAGLFAGALESRTPEDSWRLWWLVGLIAAPALAHALIGTPAPQFATGAPVLIVSGLLVGFGARLGSGCTSGHGVCGLARLSPRSLVATLSFMAAGFATVWLVRHGLS